MWTVIYCAKTLDIAEAIKSGLGEMGVLVRINACGQINEGIEWSGHFFDVSVTASDVELAHHYIIEHGY